MADRKNVYVLDASVMVKWLFQEEEGSDLALKLRNDYFEGKLELVVPVHSFFEVSNTVGLKLPDLALSFLSQLFVLGLDEYQLNLSIASKAFELLKKVSGVAFYDAIYHALAMKLGGTFVTADEKYFQKTKHLKQVMLLKDYK